MTMHAAIYARKSRESDKGESCDNQIKRGMAFCESHGYTYETFVDEGYSGKNLDRPAFDRMYKQFDAKKFNFLICYRLDRVSRSVNDFTNLYENLKKYGVEFVSISENFDTSTPMGRAMMNIAASFAQLERETISERIKDNMVDLFKRGQWTGGKIPYGYDSTRINVAGKQVPLLVPKPEEAEIIRQIFSLYLAPGSSMATVARELIKRGITDRHGKEMNVSTINRRLTNTLYCKAGKNFYNYFKNTYDLLGDESDYNGSGVLSYGKSYVLDVRERKPKDQWMMIPGMHDGIVDENDFIAVHEKIKAQWTIAPRQGTSIYSPLTGLIKCEHCGRNMTLRKGKVKGVEYKYFYCPDHMTLHTCPQKNINAKELEEAVINHIVSSVGDQGNFLKKIEKSIKLIEKSMNAPGSGDEATKMEARIDDIKKDLSNLLDYLLRGIVSEDDYKAKKAVLEAEMNGIEQIMSNRKSFNRQIKEFRSNASNIKLQTANYARLGDGDLSFDEKKALIHSIVKEINVTDDDIEVVLYIDISALFGSSINLEKSSSVLSQMHLQSPQNRQITLSERLSIDLSGPYRKIPENSFGFQLRSWRQKYGIDAQEIADKLEMHKETIMRWERGDGIPRGKNKIQLLKYIEMKEKNIF